VSASGNGAGSTDRWERALDTGSFEEASAALEEVVARLEAGRLPLDETVALYELGVRLAARCEQDLAQAELRVRELGAVRNDTDDTGCDADDPASGIGLDDVPF